MLGRIKEHNQHNRLARKQASYILEHVYKFIYFGSRYKCSPMEIHSVQRTRWKKLFTEDFTLTLRLDTHGQETQEHQSTKKDAWGNNFTIEM